MKIYPFKRLFKKYNHNQLPPADCQIIDDWYAHQVEEATAQPDEEVIKRQMWSYVSQRLDAQVIWWRRPMFKMVSAAAALLIISASMIYFIGLYKADISLLHQDLALVEPGRYRAAVAIEGSKDTLLLGTGNKISDLQTSHQADIVLVTPKAGEYEVRLPDGSIVHLNADSRLKYPSHFDQKSRVVELSGEAYFEIAHDSAKPFKVLVNGVEVQVLGTKFNVQAYPHMKSTNVSLLEGAVAIHAAQSNVQLTPGHAALIQKETQHIQLQEFKDQNPIAWKEGLFLFNDQSIQDITADLSRWYDIEFDLGQLPPNLKFTGKISKKVNLKTVLDYLASTDELTFTLHNNKVIVKPK